MIEYRTERVDPQAENNVVSILSAFGWALVSSQEVYNESVETVGVDVKAYGSFMQGFTGKDGSINVRQRKNVTNYVTLRFARDTDMPNYERLRILDEEFESKLSIDEPKKPVKRTAITAIGMVLIIVSIIMAIAQSTPAEVWEIIVCVVFPLVTIPLTIIGWLGYKRKLKKYNYVQYRLDQIYAEALELVS